MKDFINNSFSVLIRTDFEISGNAFPSLLSVCPLELSVDGGLLRAAGDAAHGPHQVPRPERGRARPRNRRRQQIRVGLMRFK